MINDLILRVTYNGVVTDLDVDGDVPLRLDISAIDNQDIGEVYGVSSQNFNLPGTAKNNKFFNHGYLESAINVPGLYNSIECSVIRNGETLLLGNLQVNEIVTSADGFITYDVTVNNSVIDFNQSLQDKFLYQANWSQYDHTLNTANVFKSWNPRSGSSNSFILDSGKTGSVYYPYIDYGFDSIFTWPAFPVVSATSGSSISGGSGSTAQEDYPLNLAQTYPAIGAREVFDAIFQQAGFEYSSSFIDSSDFDDVYVLTKNQEGLGVVGAPGQVSNNLFSGSVKDQFNLPSVQGGLDYEQIIPFTGSIYDPGSNYSTSTYYYTATTPGRYNFNIQVDFENSSHALSESDAPDYNLYFTVDTVNSIQDTTQLQQTVTLLSSSIDSASFYSAVGSPSLIMNPGDRASVTFEVNNREGQSGPEDTDPTPILTSSFFKVIDAPFDYQEFPVKMGSQIDSDIKSIDMFKALLTQFNLVAYPDQSQQRVINIETFDTWMRQGEIKDWSSKYNTATRISIKNPVVEQPRELRFQNATDDDRISKLADESTPNFQYGTLRALSNSSLTEGETVVESLFAPTVLAPAVSLVTSSFSNEFTLDFNQGANNFIIPHLYKFKNSKQESFKFKPRIGYKSYYKDNSLTGSGANLSIVSGSTSDLTSPVLQYMSSGSITGKVQFRNYSTLTNYQRYPVTGTTKDLLFNSSYNKLSTSQALYPSSGSSNFVNYWKTYKDSLYWEDGKKIIVDLYFDEFEYQDIKLNDQIVINDNRYRINKIQGFNLTRRDVVTVELLKLFPAYTPVIPSGGGTTCPAVQTNPATNITGSQFTANGEVSAYGTEGTGSYVDTGFILSFTGATDPEIGDPSTFKFWSGNTPLLGVNFSHVFAGLTTGTTYSFRAMISSSNPVCDQYIYGDTEFVTTLTSSACPTAITYGPFDITSASFTMSGSAVDNGLSIVERGFVVSKTDSTPTIAEGADKYPTGSGAGQFDYVNFPATASTQYYYRAYASASGCIEYGDTVGLNTSASAGACLPFSASSPTNFGGACSETITQVLYTDYSGSWPPTQAYLDGGGVMHVYTSAGCSVASFNTYYAFDSSSATGTDVNSFLRVDDAVGTDPGSVILISNCEGP